MARLDPIPMDQMTPEQRRLNDKIAGSRGGGPAKGPFALWLRTPELADHANAFGTYLRHGTSVPQRLVELAVLIVARTYTAQYEWHAHAAHADRLGLSPELVEAIRTRKKPVIVEKEEKIVHAVTTELTVKRKLSAATYALAKEILGEQMLLDLVTIIGFYTMVAVVLVAFDVDIPDGGDKPLAE